jgi:CRISPR-associated endonuclease/helicase Cas3
MTQAFFTYWGKARPSSTSVAAYHPLAYHCLDVAAVGVEYLRRSPRLGCYLGAALNIPDEEAVASWYGFWLALHDLGKFSEAFQAQRKDIFQDLRARPPHSEVLGTLRHDSIGFLMWQSALCNVAREEHWLAAGDVLDEPSIRVGLEFWVTAVTGHHGKPPRLDGNSLAQFCDLKEDLGAASAFARQCAELFKLADGAHWLAQCDPGAFEKASKQLSWWTAGLAVLSDWIGSNTDYFPYHTDVVPLAEYWSLARAQAAKALRDSGALTIPAKVGLDFHAIFPEIACASPLQQWAMDCELSAKPQIFCLEDVTGAGKTEAAIALAYRLMESGAADGLFIGLPTMATANAMYGRLARMYQRLFDGDPSLALAHGQRDLVEGFAASVLPADADEKDPHQFDESASARCAAWLADHNKRSLLAPVGVGTVDQALLAVLHSRHQSLRLLGLFRKVLIVDEVHACDSYMQSVLCSLLEFHARAGGSAILLSATLPRRMKEVLFGAFAKGLAKGGRRGSSAPPEELCSKDYPLVSVWRADQSQKVAEHPIATREVVRRQLSVQMLTREADVLEVLMAALHAGQCVCWIRNTVADVLEAYDQLRSLWLPEQITLFHARFALRERLRIEQQILALFGPESVPEQRRGRLVIASQVAEQSLDADWDLVVTDLAPIDRLLQRAGRLRRHPRDASGRRLTEVGRSDERGEPCLWVFAPEWTEEPNLEWYSRTFPRAAKVYPEHHWLWLTARLLSQGALQIPEQSRDLIEAVFGDVELPPGMRRAADNAESRYFAEKSVAMLHALSLVKGYASTSDLWWDESKSPSRLGEATSTVLLARWVRDELRPWDEDAHEPRHRWAYSTVRVVQRLIAKSVEPESPARKLAFSAVLESLPNQGRWAVLLPLEQTAEGWSGEAWSQSSRGAPQRLRWRYDERMGLLRL